MGNFFFRHRLTVSEILDELEACDDNQFNDAASYTIFPQDGGVVFQVFIDNYSISVKSLRYLSSIGKRTNRKMSSPLNHTYIIGHHNPSVRITA